MTWMQLFFTMKTIFKVCHHGLNCSRRTRFIGRSRCINKITLRTFPTSHLQQWPTRVANYVQLLASCYYVRYVSPFSRCFFFFFHIFYRTSCSYNIPKTILFIFLDFSRAYILATGSRVTDETGIIPNGERPAHVS